MFPVPCRWAIVLLCACSVLLTSCARTTGDAAPVVAKIDAPNFPTDLQWLNVDKPLSLADLRGKVVVLDFWTFCCINCMHSIPDLKRLEAKYGDALAVIGVHTAKFVTEKETDNIRAAILRYDVRHPVINDSDFEVWNLYGVHAWPTFVLIDPDGKIVDSHAGEGPYDAFDQTIHDLIQSYDAQKKINRTPLALHLEKDKAPSTPLLFPGKIATDADGKKLFVSDSNHNRIVVLNIADQSIDQIIGSGTAGLKDGNFDQAEFFRPQGLAIDSQTLYVADTENHAIRKVDLAAKTVTTIAGTGHQAHDFNVAGHGTAVDLSSPWDVLAHDGTLYIAMAGMHQIWTQNPATLDASPFAGSASEDISDGPLLDAALAQPSGLATDGKTLYSADSESSSIRAIDFDASGSVRTVVGHGLFVFGDQDGTRDGVRLQHPLGVTFHGGLLYVADTYNNKIKTIDPASGEAHTLIGTGEPGFTDGQALSARLNEPGGLVFAGDKLYIADTNNHLIRVYDPASGVVSTFKIAQAEKLLPPQGSPIAFDGTTSMLQEQHVAAGAARIEVNVIIPSGYAFNTAAPFYVGVSSDNDNIASIAREMARRNLVNPSFPLEIPLNLGEGKANLSIDLIVYYCDAEHESVCLVKRLRYIVPIVADHLTAVNVVRVEAVLENPAPQAAQ